MITWLCCNSAFLSDDAFPPATGQTVRLQSPELVDKEIRAVFMRALALLLQVSDGCSFDYPIK